MKKLVQWTRSILFSFVFAFWSLVPTALVVWVAFLPLPVLLKTIRFWQWGVMFLARFIVGIKYKVVGWENVPKGACIIASKHQSAYETCLLHILFGDPAIVLKKELTRIPIWGWYAKYSGLIPIDRKGGVKSLSIMKKACDDAVKAGRKIVIFPQGTRVAPGVKKPYKVGVVALYQDLDIPVVPVALNSGLFWPKKGWLKYPGTVTIAFLPPIPAGLSRSQMMRRLEHDVETESARLAGISVPYTNDQMK
ncbi:MAG: lysophospholipid acyltransferase family protein [Alphaproteobacteria bacterium]|nr:lysophospholipid acyltransferase family protein [Alphaproteobacteria bacterium]